MVYTWRHAGLVQSSVTVPLIPTVVGSMPGIINTAGIGTARFLPRLYQLDLAVKKNFRLVHIDWLAEVSVFNVLNVDTWYAERSANFDTPAFAVPSSVHQGRLMRLALQMKWSERSRRQGVDLRYRAVHS